MPRPTQRIKFFGTSTSKKIEVIRTLLIRISDKKYMPFLFSQWYLRPDRKHSPFGRLMGVNFYLIL